MGLSEVEYKIAQQITDIALANAASSFSTVTKDEVVFQNIELNPKRLKFDSNYISAQSHLYILITEFKGDILADSFLILNQQSADEAVSVMYPQPNLNDTMKDAVLLELDNILAASVATKFADILDKDVKGDVPQMLRKNFIKAQSYIDEKLASSDMYFSSITLFKSKRLNLEAKFVCAFKDSFIATIKEMAKNTERVDEIHRQHQNIHTQKFMRT